MKPLIVLTAFPQGWIGRERPPGDGAARVKTGCFIRELLLTFSLSSTTCDSAWVSRGFSVIKHV